MKPESKNRWILLLSIIAVLVGALGYARFDGAAHKTASSLFYVFLLLFAAAMTGHLLRGRRPDGDS